MKISVFTCILNPSFWCFPYKEAIKSWLEIADEIVIVDGGSNDGSLDKIKELSDKIKIISLYWPWNFKQREFPLHLNIGLNACTGDWVIKFDIDFVLHEFDALAFKHKLLGCDDKDILAASFTRINLLNRFEGILKGDMSWAIHKKFTGKRIQFGVETNREISDWSQAIIVENKKNNIPYGYNPRGNNVIRIGNPVYNYDCFFRDKVKCKTWFLRSARAYRQETNKPLYGATDEDAWKLWCDIRRLQRKHCEKVSLKITDHPKVIQDKLNNMTSDMWGHSNFNWNL